MTEPHVWTRADAAAHIRVPTDADDKYSRGVVGLRTGTPAYPGAAVLGVEGAWRAGAGMVRWVGDPDVGRLVLARQARDGARRWPRRGVGDRLGHRREGAGPAEERSALRDLLAGDVPVIVDAGALDLAAGADRAADPHPARRRVRPAAGEPGARRGGDGCRRRRRRDGGGPRPRRAAQGRRNADRVARRPADRGARRDAVARHRGRRGRARGCARCARRPGRRAARDLAALAATAAWLHGRAARIAAHADAGPGSADRGARRRRRAARRRRGGDRRRV